MAKSDNGEVQNKSSITSNNDPNNSFMKKVTSRVSGLLPSSISKWFGETGRSRQVVRRRDSEEADDVNEQEPQVEPPKKRARNTFGLSDATFSGIGASGFSVTSTPLAGPSGYSRPPPRAAYHNHRDSHLNGDDRSDSGESSGYSSVPMPHKDSSSDKEIKQPNTPASTSAKILNKSPVTPVRSLFSEQSLNQSQQGSCMASRRPSFNASTFGSPSFVDRTLSTTRVINSPFYAGRTFYGGAAGSAHALSDAHGRSKKMKIFPTEKPNAVQVKPVQSAPNADINHLSKTAKRILDALEHFSSGTPVLDAKKIPVVQKKPAKPANKQLMVPTVPDLLKMKLKRRIQDTTVAVRNLTNQKSIANQEYTINPEQNKHSNKMKHKISSTREKVVEEPLPEVNLPNIQLPITTLPKFDFNLAAPAAAATVAPASSSAPYTFSSPILVSSPGHAIASLNSFKFSEPIDGKSKPSDKPNNLDQFKPSASTWECSTCLVRNLPHLNRCVACETSRASEPAKLPPLTSFGDKFKPASDTWECTTCMIRNKKEAQKCLACESPCPGQKAEKTVAALPSVSDKGFGELVKKQNERWECSVCLVRNAKDLTSCSSCGTTRPGQGAAQTPQSNFKFGIQNSGFQFGINNASDSHSKASGFTFGAQNSTETKSTGFTFGVTKTDEQQKATGFTFGVGKAGTDDQKSTGFTFGAQNKDTQNQNQKNSPTPPTTAKSDSEIQKTSTFSFGVQKNSSEESSGFNFGATKSDTGVEKSSSTKSDQVPKSTGFCFGAPKNTIDEKKETEINKGSSNIGAVNFGSEKISDSQKSVSFNFGTQKKSDCKSDIQKDLLNESDKSQSLVFGVQKSTPDVKTDEKNEIATSTSFSFGAPKDTEVKDSFTEPGKSTLFNFSNSKGQDAPKSTGINFNSPSCGEKNSTKPGETKKPFSFGGPAAFEFGAPKTSVESPKPTEAPKPASTVFGSASTSTFTFAPQKTNTFSFGTSSQSTSETQKDNDVQNNDSNDKKTEIRMVTFGDPKNDLFKSNSVSEANKVDFDNPKSKETDKAKMEASKTTSMFSFSNQSTDSVGGAPVETKPAVFSFGTTENKTESAKSVFNFSETKPAESKSDMFVFGGGLPSAPTPQFNFSGGPKPAESKPFSFGSDVQKPQFGEAPKPVFAFGGSKSDMFSLGAPKNPPDVVSGFGGQSQAASQNGGFSFAASTAPSFKFGSAPSAATQQTPVFNFGQASTSTPTGGVFTFGGGATAASPAATLAPQPAQSNPFAPNFGATSSTFTSQAGAPVRRIRKAVRRIQPR